MVPEGQSWCSYNVGKALGIAHKARERLFVSVSRTQMCLAQRAKLHCCPTVQASPVSWQPFHGPRQLAVEIRSRSGLLHKISRTSRHELGACWSGKTRRDHEDLIVQVEQVTAAGEDNQERWQKQ